MFDKKLMKRLKEEGVDPAVILKIMLEDETDQETPEAAEDPAPAPSTDPAQPAAQDPQPAAAPAGNDKILEAIERLTGAIQAANIRGMNSGGPQTETADDILASMIAPKKKGDK